jgi:hypothetical protein
MPEKTYEDGAVMKIRYLIAITLLFCMTTPSFATIYKWTDEKGSTNYTDDIKNVPEQYQENAKDFDKIDQEGSITYDPEFGVTKKQKSNKEPYYKRFLRELEEESEERAKADKKKKVILYMTDW